MRTCLTTRTRATNNPLAKVHTTGAARRHRAGGRDLLRSPHSVRRLCPQRPARNTDREWTKKNQSSPSIGGPVSYWSDADHRESATNVNESRTFYFVQRLTSGVDVYHL